MRIPIPLLTLIQSLSLTATAQYKGFNLGSAFTDFSPKAVSDFEYEFNSIRSIGGAAGFTSARLDSIIQANTLNTPTTAIQAAINTQTRLLISLRASAGQRSFNHELIALQTALTVHGKAFSDLLLGLSIGTEDLYRIANNGGLFADLTGPGLNPADLIEFIHQARRTIAGTPAANVPIGHIDTWPAYLNASNAGVIAELDWIGYNGSPYFQPYEAGDPSLYSLSTSPSSNSSLGNSSTSLTSEVTNKTINSISNAAALLLTSLTKLQAVSQGKPIWIAETGWPVAGSVLGAAEPSIANAKQYWDEVGCGLLFGKINTFWYVLRDTVPSVVPPSFGVVDAQGKLLYDLTCPVEVDKNRRWNETVTVTVAGATATVTQVQLSTVYVGQGVNSALDVPLPLSDAGSLFPTIV